MCTFTVGNKSIYNCKTLKINTLCQNLNFLDSRLHL